MTHGHKRRTAVSPTYSTWQAMRKRCANPHASNYRYYGGRGITVCARWASFENFLADMGERPEGLTLDRHDNDRHYEPDNCVWATRKTQAVNRSMTIWVTLAGRTQCVADWARECKLSVRTVWSRRRYGWSWEQAIMTPSHGDRGEPI